MPLKKSTVLLCLILAAISTIYIAKWVILPNIDLRMQTTAEILAGEHEPPYQYRILKPLVARALTGMVAPFTTDRQAHVIASGVIAAVSFTGIFILFYTYLRRYFSHRTSLIGIIILQVVIPISVTGNYMIGDFITVLFYLIGLNLMVHRKDAYLPLVMLLGAFNRAQIIFLLVFYLAYLFEQRTLRTHLHIVAQCVLAFIVGFISIRWYFGLQPTRFTIASHLDHNIQYLIHSIAPRWLAQVAGFVVLSIMSWKKCGRYFALSFASLGLYFALFAIYGNLWEMAKFLPAFLVLIPMSLATLTGEEPTAARPQ